MKVLHWLNQRFLCLIQIKELIENLGSGNQQLVLLIDEYDKPIIDYIEDIEQAEKVVVVGAYEGEQFVANKIVTKCPSKYEPDDITAKESE